MAPYFGVLCAMQHNFAMAGSLDNECETRAFQGRSDLCCSKEGHMTDRATGLVHNAG